MLWIIIGLLVIIIISALFSGGGGTVIEGMTVPRRSDVGRIADGWTEEPGYERDLRYTETFTDLQGLGVATDFCRAVQRVGDPGSLQIACAVGRREGMDTLEYRSRTQRDGFRFSRDDYWRRGAFGRMDYCRIVPAENATSEFYPTCAIAGLDGFKRQEERDTDPPQHIRELIHAYEGAHAWFRFIDDAEDSTGRMALAPIGKPIIPTVLRPAVSRGVQFNRWPIGDQQANITANPMRDAFRWGDPKTFQLEPRGIRSVSFWIWWDAFAMRRAAVWESGNEGGRTDRVWFGVEGGSLLPAAPTPRRMADMVQEVRPELAQAVGHITEPFRLTAPPAPSAAVIDDRTNTPATGKWIYEVWDGAQCLMRLEAPAGTARTGKWQHVVLTVSPTTPNDWWPTWQLWLDGHLAIEKVDGRHIPAEILTDNYLGRGLRGCLMDFRVYGRPLTPSDIQTTRLWALERLHPTP